MSWGILGVAWCIFAASAFCARRAGRSWWDVALDGVMLAVVQAAFVFWFAEVVQGIGV